MPPVLHGQIEVCRHRRADRKVPEQVQGWNLWQSPEAEEEKEVLAVRHSSGSLESQRASLGPTERRNGAAPAEGGLQMLFSAALTASKRGEMTSRLVTN